jgi:hypothetical protein
MQGDGVAHHGVDGIEGAGAEPVALALSGTFEQTARLSVHVSSIEMGVRDRGDLVAVSPIRVS